MLRKLISLIITCCLSGLLLQAQDGKISGKVTDETGEPAQFARVLLYDGELVVKGAQTDDEGKYSIAPVEPGTYDVEIDHVGNKTKVTGVIINPNQTRTLDITFKVKDAQVKEQVITAFKIPVFEKDAPSGSQITGEDVKNRSTRNVQSLAAVTAGVFQADEGSSAINIRGAGSNSTIYVIDGQKVRGGVNLPQSAIAQLQVITGGTPAEFGDFTGGVIAVTTAKPASQVRGSVELLTSEFLDAFGRNLAAISVSGPIATRKKEFSGEIVKLPMLGYFAAIEGDYNRDRNPTFSTGGLMRLKDDLLQDFQKTPLQLASTGRTFISRANYVTADDLEPFETKDNLEQRLKVLGRIDFQPSDNILVKFGGNVELSDQDVFSLGRMVFSPGEVGNFRSNTYRGWLRFQQDFQRQNKQEGDKALIKNFFYMIQGDYSRYQRLNQSYDHQDRLFDYGYVGKFSYDRDPFYIYRNDPFDPVSSHPYWRTAAYGFNNLRFDGSESKNPLYANYNTQILDHVAQKGIANPFRTFLSPDLVVYDLQSLANLQFMQGVLNGSGPRGIYGLYSGIGSNYGSFSKFEFDQYRLSGQATTEIKGHNFKVGFEYEQRVERAYAVGPRGLWGLMRRQANRHFATNLDENPAHYEYIYNENGIFLDTVNVPPLYVAEDQTNFDRNIRSKLGLNPNGTDYINIDEYGPDFYSIDMFSADELLDDGSGPLSYYGYNYLGERQDRDDPGKFFSDTLNRPMNPYSPTYVAGFIQDKFEFEDIIFNIGFRVDRFDANQPVLKDPFSLHPTFKASETANQLNQALPANVGDDWVAYVDDALNPSKIVGYREGQNWYDTDGGSTNSSNIVAASGGKVQPHVKEDKVTIESFEDYKTQTTFMPRISFSFPISDVAVFFAHYDVLSQRPGQRLSFQTSGLAGQLSQYAFLANNPTLGVGNPNLKPEVTVDYEVGFRQKIGDRMALSIQAFYREQRNMVRFRRFVNAYPFTYDASDNLNYGTVKGLSLSYDMRRMGNFRTNVSYTLQYANNTGATASAARNLSNSLEGVDVLLVQVPSGIDQRHALRGVFDYRFARAKGPALKMGKSTVFPLQNFGANLVMILGSGTPYSQSAFAVPAVGGTPIQQVLSGTLNGKRLPFNFRSDLRLDKSFILGGKQRLDETVSKMYDINVSLNIFNLFNNQNILGVYRYTGLPNDDGYLDSDIGQQEISTQVSPQSFVDLYRISMNNPFNYSRPRTIQLGLLIGF